MHIESNLKAAIFLIFASIHCFSQATKDQELEMVDVNQIQRGVEEMRFEMNIAEKLIKPTYIFNKKLTYKIIEPGLGKKYELRGVNVWISPNGNQVMLEKPGRAGFIDVRNIVVDKKDSLLLIFQGQERNGSVTAFPQAYIQKFESLAGGMFMGEIMPQVAVYEPAWDNARKKLKPAGRTKNIAGFECNLYSVTTPDGVFNFWYTQNEHPSAEAILNLQMRHGFPVLVFASHPEQIKNSLLMEAEQWSLDSKLIFNFRVDSYVHGESYYIETKRYLLNTFD